MLTGLPTTWTLIVLIEADTDLKDRFLKCGTKFYTLITVGLRAIITVA